MSISFSRIDPTGADRAELVAFLTGNEFPFHVNRTPDVAQVEAAVDDGAYRDEENDSFWIEHATRGRVGFIRFEDLEDPTPLFDLRLAQAHRGHGLGAPVLTAATAHLFGAYPDVTRFEGQTREDNLAMRRVFERCGWVQEAYYRESWPVDGGPAVASVAYAVLRRDWEDGTTTPVRWGLPG